MVYFALKIFGQPSHACAETNWAYILIFQLLDKC